MSVVGKYRYFMHSPAEHDSVPVIVDIILVGRTKIITLHSSVWLENLTDRRVAFRLHVPITPLVAPVAVRAGTERQAELKSDSLLGPLPPGEGVPANPLPSYLQNLVGSDKHSMLYFRMPVIIQAMWLPIHLGTQSWQHLIGNLIPPVWLHMLLATLRCRPAVGPLRHPTEEYS